MDPAGRRSIGVTIELLYWAGCPSIESAIQVLETELARRGLDGALLHVRQIVSLDEARNEHFTGSPTIRVNGRDVADDDGVPALGCRVYRLRDGRVSALPDELDVRNALDALGEPTASRRADGTP